MRQDSEFLSRVDIFTDKSLEAAPSGSFTVGILRSRHHHHHHRHHHHVHGGDLTQR